MYVIFERMFEQQGVSLFVCLRWEVYNSQLSQGFLKSHCYEGS